MDGKKSCICNRLEEINEFYSIVEFEKFKKYIDELVNDDELVEISVQKQYAGFQEKWYKCKICSKVWRMVYPDFPFKGIWCVVK